jgi:hypothetical protein
MHVVALNFIIDLVRKWPAPSNCPVYNGANRFSIRPSVPESPCFVQIQSCKKSILDPSYERKTRILPFLSGRTSVAVEGRVSQSTGECRSRRASVAVKSLAIDSQFDSGYMYIPGADSRRNARNYHHTIQADLLYTFHAHDMATRKVKNMERKWLLPSDDGSFQPEH